MHILIAGGHESVSLHGKKDFADVTKDFEIWRLSWIIWGAHSYHKSP